VRREILWRRSVRIRLAFLGGFSVSLILNARLLVVLMLVEMLTFIGGVCFLVRAMTTVMSFFLMELFVGRLFVVLPGAGQRFAREQFDLGVRGRRQRRRQPLRLLVRMSMIVIFQVFEDVADVEESVAIEADVHEGRLHARKDAGDFAFIDAADEREFFFAFDVDFD
jgi:hypothetical protein